ncbi:sigma 54-interacting transcriptional regulator [Desulfobacterium sp. N47]|uniref:sigma 54-interacting transcriptional regulator n=1 Tax=Desulfobacterium sp. N47 TaxID=3115210 RepID=UPI003CA4E11A
MKKNEPNLIESLEFYPENGIVKFKGQRMLILAADALGLLRKELIETLGENTARGIITRFGFACGYNDGMIINDFLKGSSSEEKLKYAKGLHVQEGSGNIFFLNYNFTFDYNKPFYAEYHYADSYEVEQHLLHIGKSNDPVCWTMIGYASGVCTAITGEKIYFIEDECIAKGDSFCHAIGKPLNKWHKNAELYLEYYKTKNIDKEIKRLERKLILKNEEIQKKKKKIEKLKEMVREKGNYRNIIGNSEGIKDVFYLIDKIANKDINVFIEGESGVGKELTAIAVHNNSFRAKKNFVAINCGALPETLLESELFGYKKGSFTGADKDKKGLFEEAEGGTIFLDEISETSPSFQIKLLRAIEERKIRKIGMSSPIKIDVRVISATNSKIEDLIDRGIFRKDLYYRLNGIKLLIPPLRNRKVDIIPLATYFIEKYKDNDKQISISSEAKSFLLDYSWPGNVRELLNVMQRALALLDVDDNIIYAEHLTDELKEKKSFLVSEEDTPLAKLEERHILKTLDKYKGNKINTAKALCIAPSTLWRKLKNIPL